MTRIRSLHPIIADLFTKAVSRQVLEKLLGALTGYESPQSLEALLLPTG